MQPRKKLPTAQQQQAFFDAINQKDEEKVKELIFEFELSDLGINFTNNNGDNPLIVAVRTGREDIVSAIDQYDKTLKDQPNKEGKKAQELTTDFSILLIVKSKKTEQKSSADSAPKDEQKFFESKLANKKAAKQPIKPSEPISNPESIIKAMFAAVEANDKEKMNELIGQWQMLEPSSLGVVRNAQGDNILTAATRQGMNDIANMLKILDPNLEKLKEKKEYGNIQVNKAQLNPEIQEKAQRAISGFEQISKKVNAEFDNLRVTSENLAKRALDFLKPAKKEEKKADVQQQNKNKESPKGGSPKG